ncbi:nucleotidyl transferase AbiEii/AbiGii toxin family protein [Catenuloplanes indicus]|uniref:Nucleotidyltransferase AbiEii toxin of type IV toxin-antitoxin system n=1 Tax=Catenuloplanes indicus TaxID=137267 RepID=A0AAE3W0F9_9ACTN|nr:nucleotidyl transferase AbiEii/AbiGii toxin family protein [Catenuloplanes indicus]MDQ0366987.1 hypothetical protein [Catenuloplanes indicus]
MDQRHRHLTEIALAAAGEQYGLALAGGYAVRVHGIGERPSSDIDLFTDWQRRADFPAVVDLVAAALERAGFTVTTDARAETFARLLVNRTDDPGGRTDKIEMAADWRSHPPVQLDIGPVLHPDDAVANKMAALYARAVARDFLDVHAILDSGRYSREQLLHLAVSADPGFDRTMFARALGMANEISEKTFAAYGTDGKTIASLRQAFAEWRRELVGDG